MSDLSRVEQLLRNALGEDIYEVTPQSRVEVLLQQLNEYIEGMGGGSVDPEVITAWLAENIHDGAVVDNSLTIEGAAADAKKTGTEISQIKEDLSDTKSGFNQVVSDLTDKTEYDFSKATVNTYHIPASSPNAWKSNAHRHGYIFPVEANALQVTIKANANYNTSYAFLKSNSQSTGSVVDYCDGTTRNSISPGESVTVFIPSDCTYMWVLKDFDGENHEPEELSFYILADEYSNFVSFTQEQTIGETEKEIARNNIGAANSNTVQKIESDIYTTEVFDFAAALVTNYYIAASTPGVWKGGTNRKGYIFPVEANALQVTIKANANYNTAYAFLKSNSQSTGSAVDYCDNTTRASLSPGEQVTENIPSDCAYIWVLELFDNDDHTPEELTWYPVLKVNNTKIIPLGLHTMPKNKGVLNVIKRCRQMTDIKWTPAVDLPRYIYAQASAPSDEEYNAANVKKYLGTFKAGTEYKGIPYGRADYLDDYGYRYSFVGLNVDFETFVTAVQNGESILCKEISGSVANHRSIQYAAVCSALTCYALGLSTYYPTSSIPNIPGLNLVTPLTVDGEHIDPSIFELGDILNLQADHTSVITDIIKDDNGDVIYIEESEATVSGNANPDYVGGETGGVCRRVGFNVDDFFARYGEYSLYRYAKIANVTYTPSKFVNVGDEFDMARFDRLPCMPYMGENFQYKNGYIPNTKVVITTDDYSYLRVYKDGTEIIGSPFAVNGASFVETGFYETGNYIAYLCNMSDGANTIVSAKCHWTVV